MPLTLLLTGFGPFPGAPVNPTGPLIARLAGRRHPAFDHVRRITHVFATRYDAVDDELPTLLARERPDVLLMFGLATRSRHLRIETRARNAQSRTLRDAGGGQPQRPRIAPDRPSDLKLRTPAPRLLAAARSAGVPAALSRDAGRYLCNYLCWRASEAALHSPGLRLVSFIHVPNVRPPRQPLRRCALTLDDLVHAGEAIMLAALVSARH
jgi:pyroglutamyl-peptidase